MSLSTRPVISVAVFTRKTPLLILKRCLQSVRNQTLSDIEIILLDANAADSSYKKAIQSEKELLTGIEYIELPDELNTAHGKNIVLQQYQGEFLTFLSAQDTMPPQRLEQAVNAFLQNPSCIALCTGMNALESNILDDSDTDYAIHSDSYRYLSQLIFRRNCFEQIHTFDENLVAHCDEDIALQLFLLHKLLPLTSRETDIFICPDCYHNTPELTAAIGYRQLLVKYQSALSDKSTLKKQLLEKAASSYRQAGVFHRFLQFKWKSICIREHSDTDTPSQ